MQRLHLHHDCKYDKAVATCLPPSICLWRHIQQSWIAQVFRVRSQLQRCFVVLALSGCMLLTSEEIV